MPDQRQRLPSSACAAAAILGISPLAKLKIDEVQGEPIAAFESRYLMSASVLLAQIASVLVDTGLRPDECFRLRWEDLTWVIGRNGTLLVTHGKTASATARPANDSEGPLDS